MNKCLTIILLNITLLSNISYPHIKQQTYLQQSKHITQENVKETTLVKHNSNRWNIKLNKQEKELLAKVLYREAHTEPEMGLEAVCVVVFNRMKSNKFPNTLSGVLSQHNGVQFNGYRTCSSAKPTKKEYNTIEHLLSGKTKNKTIYNSNWLFFRKCKKYNRDFRVGHHYFRINY